jgi:predicted ATPase
MQIRNPWWRYHRKFDYTCDSSFIRGHTIELKGIPMRIREIFIHNVRSFRGEHRISFVESLTGDARTFTVIAGTNGAGKTTIFDAIEGLLDFACSGATSHPLLTETLKSSGFIGMSIQLTRSEHNPSELSSKIDETFYIAVGNQELGANWLQDARENNFLCFLVDRFGGTLKSSAATPTHKQLIETVNLMNNNTYPMKGGLIYFPERRQLLTPVVGPIEPPVNARKWLFRFSNSNQWSGSLESWWGWQNYHDLEQRGQGQETSHLQTYLETVEEILGKNRKITIKEGRVTVPVAWNENGKSPSNAAFPPRVRLDQLPSGEQQCILLFGELARQRRPGAVILIDEPEISLHPTMQRMMTYYPRKFAREWDSQFILATHSIEILRAAHNTQCIILDMLDTKAKQTEEVL